MFDFDIARQKGMALEIPVTGTARTRIGELYVTGVKSRDAAGQTLTPAVAATLLDGLLDSQLHDWGAGFVPTGTATNNTSDVAAGWSQYDTDPEAIYLRNVVERVTDPAAPAQMAAHGDDALLPRGALVGSEESRKSYRRLGRALGLGNGSALKRYDHRTLDEASAFEAMNAALWPVTWGETLTTMMAGPDGNHLTDATRQWARRWFRDTVKGGPYLPSIRIGNSPYGILPVQSITRGLTQSIPDAGGSDIQREAILKWTIEEAYHEWYAAAPRVLRMAERPEGLQGFGAPGERLLEILRQDPNPAHFALEKAVDTTGRIEFQYEIRKRVFDPTIRTDTYLDLYRRRDGSDMRLMLEAIWRRAGRVLFDDWPAAFSSYAHQKRVLLEKRALLDDTSHGRASIWDYQPSPLMSFLSPGHLRHHAYDTCIGYLDDLIEILDRHMEGNALFRSLFGTAGGAFKGAIGETTKDAAQVFLAFEDKNETWHPDDFVRIRAGADTVAPANYFEMSDAEKLKAPSFEPLQSGLRMGGGEAISGGAFEAVTDVEEIVIDPELNQYLGRTRRKAPTRRATPRRRNAPQARADDPLFKPALSVDPAARTRPAPAFQFREPTFEVAEATGELAAGRMTRSATVALVPCGDAVTNRPERD
ncbi:hypothetical protein XM53_03510 [Roseovarius atlanticus]|uniref:Uncharacterized protein n=1 Tax=Roseovarius atlanticus TaxID=1641875 RepID=A0A0T5NXM8_9RHOB|nr:hypothetical protein [Roseovarius atlanticus]KRS13667.1 hypothetical protein XM53_03510 [Roseovarius atlanticus]